MRVLALIIALIGFAAAIPMPAEHATSVSHDRKDDEHNAWCMDKRGKTDKCADF